MLGMDRRGSLAVTLFSLVLVVAGTRAATAQTAVTSCEQIVEDDAYLVGDLDCGPEVEAAVQILKGGSLDMNGFSIHGGEYGVLCAEENGEGYVYTPCRVFGGGTIDGQSVVGIVASRMDLTDVTIDMSDSIALIVHSRLTFSNVSLQLGPNAVGVLAGSKVRLRGAGLAITGGDVGIVSAGRIKIDGVMAAGYADFTRFVGSAKLANATLGGGANGIDARVAILTDSSVTGHAGTAIHAERIRLTRSTVTGNGLDLDALAPPRLRDSTCGTSNGWGVCTGD